MCHHCLIPRPFSKRRIKDLVHIVHTYTSISIVMDYISIVTDREDMLAYMYNMEDHVRFPRFFRGHLYMYMCTQCVFAPFYWILC